MSKKKILGILGIIVVLVVACILVWNFTSKKTSVNEDALKFKEEYEAYNGKENSSGTNTYQTLNIDENSKVKYADVNEVIEMLKSGTGLIYFGFPNCPWCRNAVPVLFEALNCGCLDHVLYLNVTDLRDKYEVKNGKVVVATEATSEYKELLNLLGDYLEDYILTDEDGKEYKVGEKRLYVPLVVGVKNGTIVGTHADTVTLKDNQTAYDELDEEQKKTLKNIYNNLIDEVTKEQTVCNEHC